MTEDSIQSKIYVWYNNTYCLRSHNPRNLIFSIPNGGTRNKVEALKMQSTGLLPGVSDLIVIHSGIVHFVEVKNEKGTQQPSQKEFQQRVEAHGYQYHLVRSLQEFKNIFGISE